MEIIHKIVVSSLLFWTYFFSLAVERLDIEIPILDELESGTDSTVGQEVSYFVQVYTSATIYAAPIVTNGGTDNTFYYALPKDCPTVCTVCTAGCLFTTTSNYVGVGIPDKSLPYSNTPSNTPGSWFGIATTAPNCISGMSIGAVTGSLVKVTGMNATYSSITGTRVSAASSTCGSWAIAIGRPTYPATQAPSLPTKAPTSKPSSPTTQPSTGPPTTALTCSQIIACSNNRAVICPVPGFNTLIEGGGAIGTYYYVLHGEYPVVYNASVTISVADLNNGTDTTTCTQDYSRELDDDGVKDCDAGHILANQLGGIGSQPINIFPQDLHINRGSYKTLETKIYDCVSTTGVDASLQWQFIYQNNTETKPTSVIYSATFASGSCAPGFSEELSNCYTACSINI